MTLLNINLTDVLSETDPDDRVLVWAPAFREGSAGGLVGPRQKAIPLVDGVGSDEVVPGPLMVQVRCKAMSDTHPREVVVPETGPVTLTGLLDSAGAFAYAPPVVGRVALDAQRAEDAAVRAEAGAATSEADATQTGLDRTAVAADRTHVDSQVAAIDTAFTASVPSYLQPDSPGGLAATYGTKPYIYEAAGEVETLFNPPRADVTIAAALQDVTLAQVQALDPEATLDDTADWYLVQKHIAECAANNIKSIRLPRGRYYMSRGIDISALDHGTYINAEGVIFWATETMPRMVWLQHRGNYWKGRRADIHGLELRGNYLAQRGIEISGVQEWSVDIRVQNCYEGISLQDVWYGQISRETVIQDCLVGLAFNDGNAMEINTIGIDNLKINFGVTKDRFPEAPGADSIGISISTILGGIDFHAVVVEGPDYGVRYMPQRAGAGRMDGLVMFTGCYWEAIKKRVFDFSRINEEGFTHVVNSLVIRGNRFHAITNESIMGPGILTMVDNQKHAIRFANLPTPTRITANVDDNVEVVHHSGLDSAEGTELQLALNTAPSVANNVDWRRFSKWGDTSAYPMGDPMVSTIGHDNYRLGASPALLRGTGRQPSKYFEARSIMPRPIVFYPGAFGEPNGPVVRGEDGKWYMIQVGADGSLKTREVKNVYRLDESMAVKTAKQLYYLKDTAPVGTRYQCADLAGTWLTLAAGRRWADDQGRLRVGTTDEALETYAALSNGNQFYDTNTGQTLFRTGQRFDLVDWYGMQVAVRIAGTAAQRPTAPPEGLVYYDTDTSSYAQYKAGAWVPFTPNTP